MATQYEVEHNIKPTTTTRRRKVDMSTFTSHLSNIDPTTSSSSHHNPHATATPVDVSALFRLLQDQMGVLASTSPTPENRDFLNSLIESLQEDIARPPTQIEGVSQEFLDGLDRVDRKKLKEDEQCPICAERYLDDQYCLVVELPCHHSHRFDLECVGPWLRSKGTCPMCRKEVGKRREVVVEKREDSEEEDDMDGLYA
ncbi:hypothetical protein B0T20DRAFT_476448 [Sordaria brevicollis]|uniref:RING-type E3 ubiquitin transferase n=1 Tax=Sordaria brevicollis TaxID=83679 RepID=A0AAE0PML0_SORBR|nr:hypothetical protein B0T20DRAFT_476448 [Sordaria brevicollis]